MEQFSVGDDVAFVPRGDLLDGVRISPLTQPSEEGALVQAAIFRFAPGGRIRRHPGTYPQILAVLEGSGEVSGVDGVDEPIGPGEAVFLQEGEDHEMTSEAGRTQDGISRPRSPAVAPLTFVDNARSPAGSITGRWTDSGSRVISGDAGLRECAGISLEPWSGTFSRPVPARSER